MTALKDVEERSDDTLREEALERLKKRQDLRAHLLVYAMVIALLGTIWVLTTPGGFPWPAIVMFRLGYRPGDERLGRLRTQAVH